MLCKNINDVYSLPLNINSSTENMNIIIIFFKLKAPYSSKIDILLSKEGLNKYSCNNRMWHLTACKISVSFSFLNWIKYEMIFCHISELMLPTLIQRYDKKIISFLIQFKNARLNEYLQAVRCHIS